MDDVYAWIKVVFLQKTIDNFMDNTISTNTHNSAISKLQWCLMFTEAKNVLI